jgi:cyclic pyranopterin phosphate synthase
MAENQLVAGVYDNAEGEGVSGNKPDRSDGLVDGFGRRITYARLSVTDRCDLRCRYCMAERMQFLPKREILTLEEMAALADILIARGVRKIRLTGGEPLVRKGDMELVRMLGKRIGCGLDELVLTTNGTRLERFAGDLHDAGVRRINVSLDSRKPERFAHITRGGDLAQVLRGIEAALAAGLAVKINVVALAGINEDEIEDMLRWCAAMALDLTLIETMPLGEVEDDRTDHYLPLDRVKRRLEERFTLVPSTQRTGGPARYFEVVELRSRLGLITPLTNNFCDGCNRIRIAATGTVYGCLGHDQKVELRDAIRLGGAQAVDELLDRLLAGKPRRQDYQIGGAPAVARHRSVTGGESAAQMIMINPSPGNCLQSHSAMDRRLRGISIG